MKNNKVLNFCRLLIATDKSGKVEAKLTVQPYCVGMYVCIDNPNGGMPMQLNMSYKELRKFIRGSKKKMESNGLTVELNEQPLTDYLSQDEIETYVLR